jgi:hypothetical protein
VDIPRYTLNALIAVAFGGVDIVRLRKKMARAGIEPATPRFSAVCSTD